MGVVSGRPRTPLLHPGRGHTAGHAPQRPSGAREGPPGPRLLPKAVLFGWLQEGTRRISRTPRPWPLAERGQGPGDGGPGWAGGASELPSGVWGAPGFPGEGATVPTQFFLALGVSYFLLLEYHSRRGIPMDGRVMTPKAAQSRKWGENLLSNSR